MTIEQIVARIRTAVYGRDVRTAIADGIEEINAKVDWTAEIIEEVNGNVNITSLQYSEYIPNAGERLVIRHMESESTAVTSIIVYTYDSEQNSIGSVTVQRADLPQSIDVSGVAYVRLFVPGSSSNIYHDIYYTNKQKKSYTASECIKKLDEKVEALAKAMGE